MLVLPKVLLYNKNGIGIFLHLHSIKIFLSPEVIKTKGFEVLLMMCFLVAYFIELVGSIKH